MKKPQVGFREDTCLSLVEGTMISTRPSTASTIDLQLLRRRMLPYKVRYTNTHNGGRQWDTRWPFSNSISNNRTRTGIFYSRTSTSGHLIEQPQQQLAWGRRHPPCIQISIYFPFILLFLSLLYIFAKKRCITKNKIKIYLCIR